MDKKNIPIFNPKSPLSPWTQRVTPSYGSAPKGGDYSPEVKVSGPGLNMIPDDSGEKLFIKITDFVYNFVTKTQHVALFTCNLPL